MFLLIALNLNGDLELLYVLVLTYPAIFRIHLKSSRIIHEHCFLLLYFALYKYFLFLDHNKLRCFALYSKSQIKSDCFQSLVLISFCC